MSSVIEYNNCPRCNQENFFEDYYYKTGEFFSSCPDCGYHKSVFYKKDNKGQFIKKDKAKDFTFDNLITKEVLINNPYGSLRIENMNGASEIGTLRNKKEYDKFVSEVMSFINQENNFKKITVSRLFRNKIKVETIYEKK